MFFKSKSLQAQVSALSLNNVSLSAHQDAMHRAVGVAEFDVNGRFLSASDSFLSMLNYSDFDDLQAHGGEHGVICDSQYVRSPEYNDFWRNLKARGSFTGYVKRVGKNGEAKHLHVSYAEVRKDGVVAGFVKIAIDMTVTKTQQDKDKAVLEALDRSMARVEFDLEGNVLSANDNFKSVMGYDDSALKNLNHKDLCPLDISQSEAYRALWAGLRAGQFYSDRVKRITRGSQVVWLQASYNPIINDDGVVTGVIKIATDITREVKLQEEESKRVSFAYEESSRTRGECEKGLENTEETITELEAMTSSLDAAESNSNELHEFSEKITAIVQAINGIAEQTNLLALNAAIEAARAGDHGRGFAVVADEVRKLSQRTSESTSEIRDMVERVQTLSSGAKEAINDVVSHIERTSTLAADTRALIETVVCSANSVVDAVEDINQMKQQFKQAS